MTHYEPRIQTCLISANVKSTQEAIAVLTKLHSIENVNGTDRTPWREYKNKNHAWGTPRGYFEASAENRGPNDSREVRHIRRERRGGNQRGNPPRDSRLTENHRNFFSGQGRNDYSRNIQLNASARNFEPQNDIRPGDNQSVNRATFSI
jgi:hypothetical protein